MEYLYVIINFSILLIALSKLILLLKSQKWKSKKEQISSINILITQCSLNLLLSIVGIALSIMLDKNIIFLSIVLISNLLDILILMEDKKYIKENEALEKIDEYISKILNSESELNDDNNDKES